MSLQIFASASAQWLWDNYGKLLIDKTMGEMQSKWQKFRWHEAEADYLNRIRGIYSTTRLFGHPKPIKIREVFTDVYVLDKPSAFRRYEISKLQEIAYERKAPNVRESKRSALLTIKHEIELMANMKKTDDEVVKNKLASKLRS